ncbi:hypothetical protein AB0F81_32610 [Actinoplanes sp. NPDC024001]|uniref:hypothetical protein n=1 Tax=Actinoplanes sp. NPDC024001 TaxID=3154598 RepID=UPI00340D2187
MNRIKSGIVGVVAVAVAVGASLFGGGQAAQAASYRQHCSDWNQSRILSDADSWGRISQRVCIEWAPWDDAVRQKIETRIDWPSHYRTWKNRALYVGDLQHWVDGKNRGRHIAKVSCDKGSFAYAGDYGSWRITRCHTPWADLRDGTYWAWGRTSFAYDGTYRTLGTSARYGVEFS